MFILDYVNDNWMQIFYWSLILLISSLFSYMLVHNFNNKLIRRLKKEVDKVNDENNEMFLLQQKLENELRNNRKIIETKEETISNLKSKIESKKQKYTSLKTEYQILSESMEDLVDKYETLVDEHAKAVNEISDKRDFLKEIVQEMIIKGMLGGADLIKLDQVSDIIEMFDKAGFDCIVTSKKD